MPMNTCIQTCVSLLSLLAQIKGGKGGMLRLIVTCVTLVTQLYRSIQIDYRQTLFLGKLHYTYRIVLPEGLISITETDLWEYPQKIFHCRYRFSLDFPLISITDTDFVLKTN